MPTCRPATASVTQRIMRAVERYDTPRERLLAVFEGQGELFALPDYRGCAFARASAESHPGDLAEQAAEAYRRWVRALLTELAARAGVPRARGPGPPAAPALRRQRAVRADGPRPRRGRGGPCRRGHPARRGPGPAGGQPGSAVVADGRYRGVAGTHMIVLPGGGYAEHAPHEAEPVASWLSEIGVQASVFRYPLNVRHPAPLDALRAEIGRRRAGGAQHIGLIGFSAGGHLAGLAALAPGAAPDEAVQFAVLGYAITSMETETYRPARLILLGEDASPQLRRSTSLDSLVTPQSPPFFVWHTAEDLYVPPSTPTASPQRSPPAMFPTPCTCSPTARTALAWPRTLARPRSGPCWRMPGSMNRRHRRDDSAPPCLRQITVTSMNGGQ